MDLRIPVDLPLPITQLLRNWPSESRLDEPPDLITDVAGHLSAHLRRITATKQEQKTLEKLWSNSRRDKKPLILGPKPLDPAR